MKIWTVRQRDLRLPTFAKWNFVYRWSQKCKEFAFDLLSAKLWLKKSTTLWNACTSEWMNLDEYQGLFICKSSSSFSHRFTVNKSKIEIFLFSWPAIIKVLFPKIWKSRVSWEEKTDFSFLWNSNWNRFSFHKHKNKASLIQSFKMILERQKSEACSKNSNNKKIHSSFLSSKTQ